MVRNSSSSLGVTIARLTDDGQCGSSSAPEVGLGEIAIDVPKPVSRAFKAYLDHTKYLSSSASRSHRIQERITLAVVPTKVRRSLCPCNANPALFLFTVCGPTAHASANLSRLSRMKDLK